MRPAPFATSPQPEPILPTPIAFLAIAEAQQLYHWLPAALELAKRDDVRVSILSPSPQILDLVLSYDTQGRFELVRLRRPPFGPDSLFRQPSRLATLLLNYSVIRRFPVLVTTEISSAWLKRVPGFSSRIVVIKHGAGDRAGGYRGRHALIDLTLVAGEKDRRRMIEHRLSEPGNVVVGGYAKFEICAERQRYFDNDRPTLFYNPHFDAKLSSWPTHGPEVLAALEALEGWNVIIAPHTKLAQRISPITTPAPHIRVDMGSHHSIDMSYTMSSDVYLGDVSSQVYEFLLHPRPCIFLNLDRLAWCDDPAFAHWHLGQVIEDIAELPAALARAADLQPIFVDAQEAAMHDSIDQFPIPASTRQADIILNFARAPR